MRIEGFAFGSIRIDGSTFEHDVVLDHGSVHKRRKKDSKRFRDRYGHTPLTTNEPIPWDCRHLVIGTGVAGALPVMDDVLQEAERRGIELTILPTPKAIELLQRAGRKTNAVLHVTC